VIAEMSDIANGNDLNEAPSLLSNELESYIKNSDREFEEEDKEARLVVARLVRSATSSLEGFAPSDAKVLLAFWEKHHDIWKWAADEFYSRQCVGNIETIVRRFLKLSPVLVGRIPNTEVSVYLREATQCFLHGFFQACTALSRAAMEAGINELLGRQLGAVPNVDLVDKLRQLERFKLLDSRTASEAHEVRKAGGSVLHRSPAPEKLAFEALLKARRVLMKLYAA
jgi:hypothetical protein